MIQVLATSQLTSRPLATHSRTNLRTALVFCQGIGRSKVIYSFGRFLSCNFGRRFLISQVQARSTDRCGCGPSSMSGNNPDTKLIHSGLTNNTFRGHSGRSLSQTVFFRVIEACVRAPSHRASQGAIRPLESPRAQNFRPLSASRHPSPPTWRVNSE